MRVLLIGSSKWRDEQTVWTALNRLYTEHGPYTLIHGARAIGADAMAHTWHRIAGPALGVGEIQYRANWAKSKQAAVLRYQRMIQQAGGDLALAFRHPADADAQYAVDLARGTGIEVREYPWHV